MEVNVEISGILWLLSKCRYEKYEIFGSSYGLWVNVLHLDLRPLVSERFQVKQMPRPAAKTHN